MATISGSRPRNSQPLPPPRLAQLARNRFQPPIRRSITRSDSSTPRAACCRGRSRVNSERGSPSKQHLLLNLWAGSNAGPFYFVATLQTACESSLPNFRQLLHQSARRLIGLAAYRAHLSLSSKPPVFSA